METDKDKIYEKKVKYNGIGRNYYVVKLLEETKDVWIIRNTTDKIIKDNKERTSKGFVVWVLSRKGIDLYDAYGKLYEEPRFKAREKTLKTWEKTEYTKV